MKGSKWQEPYQPPVLEEKYRIGRQYLIESIPSATQGINLERLRNFVTEQALRVSDMIFYHEEDADEVLSRIQEVIKLPDGNHATFYCPEIDIAFVQRIRIWEQLNGAFYSETLGAHELAHSTFLLNMDSFPDDGDKNHSLSSAEYDLLLWLGKRENIFEEAFAEFIRGEYAARFMPLQNWNSIRQRYQPQFPHLTLTPQDEIINIDQISQVAVRLKYMVRTRKGVGLLESAYAASALDILMDLYPDLKKALFLSRHNIEGFLQIREVIEGIENGLCKKLLLLPYNETGYRKGNSLIASSVSADASGL